MGGHWSVGCFCITGKHTDVKEATPALLYQLLIAMKRALPKGQGRRGGKVAPVDIDQLIKDNVAATVAPLQDRLAQLVEELAGKVAPLVEEIEALKVCTRQASQ